MKEAICVICLAKMVFAWEHEVRARCCGYAPIGRKRHAPDDRVTIYWQGFPGDEESAFGLDAEVRLRGEGPLVRSRT